MSLIEVPSLDLSSPKIVDEVRSAATQCGFFLLRNHGVDVSVIANAWTTTRDFFDRPASLKEETPMTDDYPYGYAGLNTEKAGNEGGQNAYATSDLKESFQLCLSSAAKPAAGLPAVRWPREPAEFRAALEAYYREMEALAMRLLGVFEEALHVRRGHFTELVSSHWSALRMLNYPEQTTPPNPGQLRIAPHSDYGVLTILRADDAPGGLQVLRADGSWSDVIIPADSFCINLGDLMQRWTNDSWRSTVHRVMNPPPNPGRPTRRQSIAFFCNLNRDASVEVLPTCVTEAQPAKYGPILAFDHLMERHARAMGAKSAFSVQSAAAS